MPPSHPSLPLCCIVIRATTDVRTQLAGIKAPAFQSLRVWKKAMCGPSQAEFAAVREIFQSADGNKNARHVWLNFLVLRSFSALKEKHPTAQALAIHIMARCERRHLVAGFSV